jgi:NAD(P)-dependent dehydrogenase (short-subunit alcohol dehydrogenase family)
MEYWKDKVVLVTGGSSGLGKVIAETFADAGAKLSIVALEEDVFPLAEAMAQGAREVLPIQADITRREDVEQAIGRTIDHYGRLDVLVNCAGRSMRGKILETSPEQFRSLFELNVLGTIQCTQVAAPHLLKTRGHVVNIGSLAAKSAARWVGAYPVSKHGVAAFSQQLRLEHGHEGLHVLLVCPGPLRRDHPRLYPLEGLEDLPESARSPGGGVQLRGIDPNRLARKILIACRKRKAELIVPWKAKLLFLLATLSPNLGDWIILKKT